ncbi:MAG: phosphoadenylyl-sulfate reductase [Acidobacteria bacterium]|nr:phosphoadenylyl-sulfate reductase [Acidobacteriota bacterium]
MNPEARENESPPVGPAGTDPDEKGIELGRVLRDAIDEFQPRIALACSFGAEDMVLVDCLARIRPDARVFYLDTDLLFVETYQLIESARRKYPLRFERVATELSVPGQENLHGPALWKRRPDLCCQIRKVEPLKRALSELGAWITGIRREQSPTRANAQIREWDDKFGLTKFNPLAFWTRDDVWNYIRRYDVPYNLLHDRNYPSIGCAPCTAPVLPGHSERDGRWVGFEKTECGLHR